MSNMRLQRLQADYEAVRRLARLHPRIEVEGVSGNPPERYRIVLKVRSLCEKPDKLMVRTQHRLEVTLPLGYPRDAPLCRMLTPVFHPNIAPHAVCIGDHWSAGESLALMIQRIGEMLAFQSYNVKSPLNGRAAQWVEKNEKRLPIDKAEFFIDLDEVESAPPAELACANCRASVGPFATCHASHALCAGCVQHCEKCGAILCLACGELHCAACAPPVCANCGAASERTSTCIRGHGLCADCAAICATCGRELCLACGEVSCTACASGAQAPPAQDRGGRNRATAGPGIAETPTP